MIHASIQSLLVLQPLSTSTFLFRSTPSTRHIDSAFVRRGGWSWQMGLNTPQGGEEGVPVPTATITDIPSPPKILASLGFNGAWSRIRNVETWNALSFLWRELYLHNNRNVNAKHGTFQSAQREQLLETVHIYQADLYSTKIQFCTVAKCADIAHIQLWCR